VEIIKELDMFEFSLYFKIPCTENRLNIGVRMEEPPPVFVVGRPTLKRDFKKPEIGPPPAFVAEEAVKDAGGHVMENENPWHAVLRMLSSVHFRMNQIRKAMIVADDDEPTHVAAIRYIKDYKKKCDMELGIRIGMHKAGFELEPDEDTLSAASRLIAAWKKMDASEIGSIQRILNTLRLDLIDAGFEVDPDESISFALKRYIDKMNQIKAMFETCGFEPLENESPHQTAIRCIKEWSLFVKLKDRFDLKPGHLSESIGNALKEKAKLEVLRDTQKEKLNLFCQMLNRHGIATPDKSISGVHAAVESRLKA
jgi:hypothetical protein